MCWLVCTTNDSNPLIDSLHHVCESVFTPLSPHHIYSMYCFLIVTILSIICSHVFLEIQLEMQKQLAHSLILKKIKLFFLIHFDSQSEQQTTSWCKENKAKKKTHWFYLVHFLNTKSRNICIFKVTNIFLIYVIHLVNTIINTVCIFTGALFINRLRAGATEEALEEQARRARKQQGERLRLEDFAQFLNLPVTDTLTQVHSLFDKVNIHIQ